MTSHDFVMTVKQELTNVKSNCQELPLYLLIHQANTTKLKSRDLSMFMVFDLELLHTPALIVVFEVSNHIKLHVPTQNKIQNGKGM